MPVTPIPPRTDLRKIAERLRVLGHPVRLELLLFLERGDYNVSQLAASCGISSHVASEHLRLMQRSGLLERQRTGKQTFYQIAELGLHEMLSCMADRGWLAATEDVR